MSEEIESVKEVFEKMPQAFQANAAKGLNVVFQFNIDGPGGGKFGVELAERP